MQSAPSVNDPDPVDGITSLGRACFDGDAARVQQLLESGADPNRPIYAALGWTITPLIAAIDACANGCVRALLEGGADPNVICEDFDCSLHGRARCTPLVLADITCNGPARRLLLHHGADLALAERVGISARAFRPARNVRAKYLASGIHVERMIRRGMSLKAIERALRRVRDIDEDDGRLLRIACSSRRGDVVQMLLAYGADPNRSWRISLSECDDGSGNVARLLLQAGYAADTQALVDAARAGRPLLIDLLIDFGADPNVAAAAEVGHWLPTPLIAAILNGNTACVEALLAGGAHPDLGCSGFPALEEYAVGSANPLLAWCRQPHEPLAAVTTTCTPLMIACGVGDEESTRLLIHHGASLFATDFHGKTATDYVGIIADDQKRNAMYLLIRFLRPAHDSTPLF